MLVVLLQVMGLFLYFYSTLMVSSSSRQWSSCNRGCAWRWAGPAGLPSESSARSAAHAAMPPAVPSPVQVEDSGLITLNKFFENKQGELIPEGVETYIDAGEAPLPPLPAHTQPQRCLFASPDLLHACCQPHPHTT